MRSMALLGQRKCEMIVVNNLGIYRGLALNLVVVAQAVHAKL